eukprot:TRINITY_DN5970_c0_g1_i1.p3 TRINITY_DN5970_c0_g1~~TRINITY_DN5970_c0_g1_i1.p3  ORF type:complete len:107 (-),score=17.73 TRINITY_DN5970_c0_g1_i1:48-368(-)
MPGRGMGVRRGGFMCRRGGIRGGKFRGVPGIGRGSFKKNIRKIKKDNPEGVVRQQDKLDRQLDKYWGKEPEVVHQALNKQLDEYMKDTKAEKKPEGKKVISQTNSN